MMFFLSTIGLRLAAAWVLLWLPELRADETTVRHVPDNSIAARISPEAIARRKTSLIDALRVLSPGKSANGKQSLTPLLSPMRSPFEKQSIS